MLTITLSRRRPPLALKVLQTRASPGLEAIAQGKTRQNPANKVIIGPPSRVPRGRDASVTPGIWLLMTTDNPTESR